jgi:hypothetical protein
MASYSTTVNSVSRFVHFIAKNLVGKELRRIKHSVIVSEDPHKIGDVSRDRAGDRFVSGVSRHGDYSRNAGRYV